MRTRLHPPGGLPFLASLLGMVWVAAFGCAGDDGKTGESATSEAPIPALFPASFTDTSLAFPQVRFADGSVCPNDRCPVRKVKLNRRLAPLYVNGRPIGFC